MNKNPINQQTETGTLAKNKKAFADYEILEKYEAGIVLTGPEVKSIRNGNVNLKSGYAAIENGEMILKNIHISPYQHAQQKDYEPESERKLLLHRKEIEEIDKALKIQGNTAVPLNLYLKKGKIKVSIGLCRGKKSYDKRDDLKKKAQNLEIRRALKR